MNKSLATINGQHISEKDFMSAVDNELVLLNDTGNIQHVMNVINGLNQLDNVTGHAKAKLLWGTKEWWKQNNFSENFSDHVESFTDIRKITVDRYVTAWNYIEDYTIPKEFHSLPMRELVPISQTLAQGYEIGASEWRKIKLSSGSGELGEILRGIKGKKPRKSARVIKLSRDGSLYGWKDDKRYFIGYLNIADAENDTVLSEFIEKIKISAGVIEE